ERPFTYQDVNGARQEVASSFTIDNSTRGDSVAHIGFLLGEYDTTKPLTIDPSVNLSNLSFSTFLGGGSNDQGTSIAADSVGNVYVTGATQSTEFPTTPGTVDTSHNGNYDVFVTKLNAAGTALIYSTFIGGSGSDIAYDIAVDASGNAFITGSTVSQSYPTTTGAYDTTFNGGTFDVFVTKLNATGSALVYSTFIGGSDDDTGLSIAIDPSGNAYVTGYTVDDVTDFPTTTGAYDTLHNGGSDVFVSKLDAAGAILTYSTFLGGNNDENGLGIAVDASGNAFVAGFTYDGTADFPTTAGAP